MILRLRLLFDIFTLCLPGHTPLSQGSVMSALPLHGIPPKSSSSFISLIRWFDLTPSPLQVTEHSPILHSLHLQSTKKLFYKRYSIYDLLVENSQSTNINLQNNLSPGHSWTLQLSVIEVVPSHSSPSYSAETFLDLVFVRVPPPHEEEQVPMIHSFHSQSTIS